MLGRTKGVLETSGPQSLQLHDELSQRRNAGKQSNRKRVLSNSVWRFHAMDEKVRWKVSKGSQLHHQNNCRVKHPIVDPLFYALVLSLVCCNYNRCFKRSSSQTIWGRTEQEAPHSTNSSNNQTTYPNFSNKTPSSHNSNQAQHASKNSTSLNI